MINKTLYRALAETFPDVTVVEENEPGGYSRQIVQKEVDGRRNRYVNYKHIDGRSRGERYRLNCPFCGDTKKRLWVSHLFLKYDLDALRRNWGNVHCFHHECHSDFENKRTLAEMIGYDLDAIEVSARPTEFLGMKAVDLNEVREIGLPGLCTPIHELDWQHPAVSYLTGRGLDAVKLGMEYGISWVSRGYKLTALDNRILVPLFRKGHLVGWSARVVGKLDESFDAPAKWLHSPGGMSGMLYGLGGAMAGPVAVAVEGPIDKWAVGKSAFAVLGKSFGYEKQQRLRQAAMVSPVQLFVVLLDPKQDERSLAKGEVHQSEKMAASLRSIVTQPVIDVRLPMHMDPGSSDGVFLAKFMYQAVKAKGYENLAGLLARSISGTSASIQRLRRDSY